MRINEITRLRAVSKRSDADGEGYHFLKLRAFRGLIKEFMAAAVLLYAFGNVGKQALPTSFSHAFNGRTVWGSFVFSLEGRSERKGEIE